MSPLLFILLLANIIEFFEKEGMRGFVLSVAKSIIMLLFAADIVILAKSWHDARDKLETLGKYCEVDGLELNPSKTKKVPFRRSGKLNKLKPLK